MLSAQEIDLIAGMCQDELAFMQYLEVKGVPCAIQVAQVAALRVRLAELKTELQRAEAKKDQVKT